MRRLHRPALAAAVAAAVSALAFGPVTAATHAAGESPEELQARLNRAEVLAGLTAVEGPGVLVVLRNSPKTPPRGVDRNAFKIHEQDVNAILNALRAGGAEALAIVGKDGAPERVLLNTAALDHPTGILVNGVAVQQPFRILAIGDMQALRNELMRPGGVVKKAGLDQLQMIEIQANVRLTIPAARIAPELRYARASDGSAAATPTGFSGADATGPGAPPPSLPLTGAPLTGAKPPEGAPSRAVPPTGGGEVRSVVRRGSNGSAPKTPPRVTAEAPTPAPAVPKPAPTKVASAVPPRHPEPRPADQEDTRPPHNNSAQATRTAAGMRPGALFGGRGLAKYHVAGCRFGERIEAGQRVLFASPEEAKQSGRMPCSICKP